MSAQQGPPPLEVTSKVLAMRHDANAYRQFFPPGLSPRLPPKLGIGLPPLRDFVGHPIITPPWPGTPQAVIVAAIAQERIAQRLINVVLDAVAPLDPASPLGNWRAVVIPLTSWTNGRVLGFVAPEDGVVVLPSAGQHGLPPESNAGDWRHVGLPPRLWIKIVIHEATHALQCRDFGNEPTNPEPDMHKLPGWRASCERLARALSGESLPDDIDVTYFPEGVGHFAPLIAQFEREVRHHLAPPRLLIHAECTPDRTVIDIAAETSRDVALGLVEREKGAGMSTRRPLSLAEIDHLIHELGILGIGIDCDGAGERWAWSTDRPLLPVEMQAAIDKARNGEPVSPDWLRDMTAQLRAQVRSFTQCADALSANDARKLTMTDGPGLGIRETLELLDGDLRMTGLTQDAAVREAHASARGELAALYRLAAGHCSRAADAVDAFRIGKWRRDYERVILSESTRAARSIPMVDGGAA